jgi:hypothetical protein
LKTKKLDCAPKLGQNIKIPTRHEVLRVLTDLNDQVVNVMFPAGDLIGLLGEFIATRFRVDVVSAEANEVEINDISVNAYYDPDLDERKKIAIELVLITNPNSQFIMLDDMTWLAFSNGIADSLAHELIHMRQHRLREFEDVSVRHATAFNEHPDAQEYLADPDEIDAYAFNIAQELKVHQNPIQKLNQIKDIKLEDSVNLWAYVQTFDRNPDHPVIKRLLKKVYKNLHNKKGS